MQDSFPDGFCGPPLQGSKHANTFKTWLLHSLQKVSFVDPLFWQLQRKNKGKAPKNISFFHSKWHNMASWETLKCFQCENAKNKTMLLNTFCSTSKTLNTTAIFALKSQQFECLHKLNDMMISFLLLEQFCSLKMVLAKWGNNLQQWAAHTHHRQQLLQGMH